MSDLVPAGPRGRIAPKTTEHLTPPHPLPPADPAEPEKGYLTVVLEIDAQQMMLANPPFTMSAHQQVILAMQNWEAEHGREIERHHIVWKCELLAKVKVGE